MKSIKAFAPAGIGNFNVGFDTLGVALGSVGDLVEITANHTETNNILEIINGENLPKEVHLNSCSVVIRKMQEHLNNFQGVDIKITKGTRSGSGMGSSSASSAAAAFAYNAFLDFPFNTKELVVFAAEGERIACGSPHVDNIAPSLLGGIVLSLGTLPEQIIKLPIIEGLFALSIFPEITINTKDSRSQLKPEVSLKSAADQTGLMGAFVSSLYEKNLERFSMSLQDLLVESSRKQAIPHFDLMRNTALENGALAFGISGSGPTVFAITLGEEKAEEILHLMENIWENQPIKIHTYIHRLDNENGARIIP